MSIHPIHSPSNPWVNQAWLHTELIKIHKAKVKEEKQRADEYSKKNLGLVLKMEEEGEKHIKELELMKRQMEADKEKYNKKLQDMSVQVDNFILQSDMIHLTSSQIAVHLHFNFSWES